MVEVSVATAKVWSGSGIHACHVAAAKKTKYKNILFLYLFHAWMDMEQEFLDGVTQQRRCGLLMGGEVVGSGAVKEEPVAEGVEMEFG